MKIPTSWADVQKLAKDIALIMLFAIAGGGVAVAGGGEGTLEPRVKALEAQMDTTLVSRVRELEQWREVDLVAKRFMVCRFDQEDQNLDPAECRHIIKRYEAIFSPVEGRQR